MQSKVDVGSKLSEKPLIIVPAAGFGTRVGSPMAKEMLVRGSDKPLIHFVLDLAEAFHWPTHVITRKEKSNLIDYLSAFEENKIQLVEPTIEWPATILNAKDYLHEWNFLILPDTQFSPTTMLKKMWENRNKSLVHYACFSIENYDHWGIVSQKNDEYFISEKCFSNEDPTQFNSFLAWGFILFHRDAFPVFELHLQSTIEKRKMKINYPVTTYLLDSFVDLGRK